MLIPRHWHGRIPACPQPRGATARPVLHHPSCRSTAHIRSCLESLSSLVSPGTKPSALAPQAKTLHPSLPGFPCLHPGSSCPPLRLQRPRSGRRAPASGLLAQRWLCRLRLLAQAARGWEACACPKSVLDRKRSQLPFLNRTGDPTAAAWASPTCVPCCSQTRSLRGLPPLRAVPSRGRGEGYGSGLSAAAPGNAERAPAVPRQQLYLHRRWHGEHGAAPGAARLGEVQGSTGCAVAVWLGL